MRTQQLIAHESGVPDTADPLAGSYWVESLTAELTRRARALMDELDRMGGVLAAIEAGWIQDQIHRAAYRWHQDVEAGRRVVVGVNRFASGEDAAVPSFAMSRAIERSRRTFLERWRAERDAAVVRRGLAALERAARGADNLMPPILEALKERATLGEVCDTMRGVFGTYQPPRGA